MMNVLGGKKTICQTVLQKNILNTVLHLSQATETIIFQISRVVTQTRNTKLKNCAHICGM